MAISQLKTVLNGLKARLASNGLICEVVPYMSLSYPFVYTAKLIEVSNNSNGAKARFIRWLIGLQLFMAVRYFLLAFLPLQLEQRVLLYDVATFYHFEPLFNLFNLCLYLMNGYFLYLLYFEFDPTFHRLQFDIFVHSNYDFFLQGKIDTIFQ